MPARRRSRIATASLTTPRMPEGVLIQPSAPQLVSSHSYMLAEATGRYGYADADRKPSIGLRDDLSCVTGHQSASCTSAPCRHSGGHISHSI